MKKKSDQLGMNASTANARLLRDILFQLVCDVGKDNCFHCGEKFTRETMSVEHKTPWLDSEDPKGLFFDLQNIAFSHLSCNSAAARKTRVAGADVTHGISGYTTLKCRCDTCKSAWSAYNKQWKLKKKMESRTRGA